MCLYLPDITYYDFRYPDATNIMIVTDEEEVSGTTETFKTKIPSTLFMYSRTWSHATYKYNNSGSSSLNTTIEVDGEELHTASNTKIHYILQIWEGDITPLQLNPDIFHEISLSHHENYCSGISCVGVVLIYREVL